MTTIEWTDETWNPLVAYDRETGKRGWFCTRVSDGCKNCYAATINRRLGNGHDYQLRSLEKIEWGLVNLDRPLRWRKPRRVFVNSMSDLFHGDVPAGFIAQVFAVMAATPQHTYQVLTKRPERMADMLQSSVFWATVWQHGMELWWDAKELARIGELGPQHPLPNVWLGTSVEDQARADERIPHLLCVPAAVRFLSCEPLLGPVGLDTYLGELPEDADGAPYPGRLHWIICGGESGPGARPCNVAWIESIRDQCRDAGVPVFVKQLGARPYLVDGQDGVSPRHPIGLDDPKGGDPTEWPEDLRVREWPEGRG